MIRAPRTQRIVNGAMASLLDADGGASLDADGGASLDVGGGGLEKITPSSTFRPCKITVIVSVLAG